MDLGETKKQITVIPLKHPIVAPSPERSAPVKSPTTIPTKVPAREKEKV